MSEWKRRRLDEAAEVVMGSSPPGDTYNSTGDGLPFLQGSAEFGTHYPSPVKWCSAPVKVAEPGDLMVSVRAPVGDTNFAHARLAIGRGLALIRGGDVASSEYLRLTLQHATADLLARSGSGMFTSITAKELKAFPIPLPSLAEQRRIVDVMAALDAQIEALDGEVARNGRAYRALLAGLSETVERRPIEGVVVAAFAGGTPPRDRPDYYDGDIPWLKSGEVEGDDIQTAAEFITRAGLLASSAKLVPVGATIVAMYGQGDTKGRAGFVGAPITTNQAVLALVPDESVVTPRFLLHSIRSQTVTLRARAIGAAQPNLSKGLVIRQEIPVYDSLVEQHTFSGAADFLRTSRSALLIELTQLRAFRSALLSSLLSQDIEIPESHDAALAVDREGLS